MWELYYEHPIVGEVFIMVIDRFEEMHEYPQEIEGCPLKYRYLE